MSHSCSVNSWHSMSLSSSHGRVSRHMRGYLSDFHRMLGSNWHVVHCIMSGNIILWHLHWGIMLYSWSDCSTITVDGISILMNGCVSSFKGCMRTIQLTLNHVRLNLGLFHDISVLYRHLVLHNVVKLILNYVAIWLLKIVAQNMIHLWSVIHRPVRNYHFIWSIWSCVIRWNVWGRVSKSSINMIKGHILGLCFGMKMVGKHACSSFRTLTLPDAPFVIGTGSLNILINVSNKPSTVDGWDILSTFCGNLTSMLTWVLPLDTIFWNSSHLMEFNTNGKAWSKFTMRIRWTMSQGTIKNCTFCATIRPLGTTLRNGESMLNNFSRVSNLAVAQVNWTIRQHLVTVNNLLSLCYWE